MFAFYEKHNFYDADLLGRVPQIHVGWNSKAHERKTINDAIKLANDEKQNAAASLFGGFGSV